MKLMGTRRDCVRSRWVLTLSVLPMLNGPIADLRGGREERRKKQRREGREGGRERRRDLESTCPLSQCLWR